MSHFSLCQPLISPSLYLPIILPISQSLILSSIIYPLLGSIACLYPSKYCSSCEKSNSMITVIQHTLDIVYIHKFSAILIGVIIEK